VPRSKFPTLSKTPNKPGSEQRMNKKGRKRELCRIQGEKTGGEALFTRNPECDSETSESRGRGRKTTIAPERKKKAGKLVGGTAGGEP